MPGLHEGAVQDDQHGVPRASVARRPIEGLIAFLEDLAFVFAREDHFFKQNVRRIHGKLHTHGVLELANVGLPERRHRFFEFDERAGKLDIHQLVRMPLQRLAGRHPLLKRLLLEGGHPFRVVEGEAEQKIVDILCEFAKTSGFFRHPGPRRCR